MKSFLTVIVSFAIGASVVFAADTPIKNAGFVPSNIWYSKDPFFAGETVRIYTIIFNGSAYDLTGTVEFFDNDDLIGKAEFSLASGGRVRDLWADWKAKEGKHIFTARIAEVSTVETGGKKRAIVLENAETGKSERFVDLDTDSDGVGNTDDLDDDDDSISDVDELRNGSDPLKKDTDGDGVTDDKELALAAKQAETSIASSTESLQVITYALQIAGDYIPVPVQESAEAGLNAIERFRIGQGYRLLLTKEEKAREIEAMKERAIAVATTTVRVGEKEGILETVSNATEKPFAYVMLAILTVFQYMFDWEVVFYGVILYIFYRLLKLGVRMMRAR